MVGIGNQYRIIDTKAGWHERAARGRLRVEGADRLAFLQALLTNDIDALKPDRGVYSAYLTPQGRLIADMRLYDRGDFILADVPLSVTAALVTRLDGIIFSEDVRVSDVSTSMAAIGVVGGRAAEWLADATGASAGVLSALPVLGVVDRTPHVIVRGDEAPCPTFDVFVPQEARAGFLARLEATGVERVAQDVAETLRIEAGRPAFGVDMDEHTIPIEAGLLERAISQTKGCYVGQEVIVRVLHRGGGRVARRLVKLAFDPALETPPLHGTSLHVNGEDVGRITSASWSPRLGRVVALGYVSRETAEGGGTVTAMAGGREWDAEITMA